VTGRPRLARREQPPLSLVQDWRKRLEAGLDGGDVDHPARISDPVEPSPPYPDSFVAFFQRSRFFSSDSVFQAQALSVHPGTS